MSLNATCTFGEPLWSWSQILPEHEGKSFDLPWSSIPGSWADRKRVGRGLGFRQQIVGEACGRGVLQVTWWHLAVSWWCPGGGHGGRGRVVLVVEVLHHGLGIYASSDLIASVGMS